MIKTQYETPTLYEVDMDAYGLSEVYEKLPVDPKNIRHVKQADVNSETIAWSGKDWYHGLDSGAQGAQYLREGWKEGGDIVKKRLSEIQVPDLIALTERARPTWGDDGDDLDPDKALAGQWDTAYRKRAKRQAVGPKAVTIESIWGGNCNVSKDQIFWTGAVMIILSDLLENAGFTTKLQATSWVRVRDSGVYGRRTVGIKDFGEPLRIDSVAAVACHAGIFRTLGFKVMVNFPVDVGEGMGSSSTLDKVLEENPGARKQIEAWLKDQGDVIRPNPCTNAAQAIAEVRRIITEKVK